MPLFTELAVDFDLALSESVVVETEMDLSLFHCVVLDSEGESEMDPPLSDARCSEMDLDFHLSDSMVAETDLEGESVAKGGAVWSSTAEAAAQTAVEVEMELEPKHRRISCPSDEILMLLLPAYFALTRNTNMKYNFQTLAKHTESLRKLEASIPDITRRTMLQIANESGSEDGDESGVSDYDGFDMDMHMEHKRKRVYAGRYEKGVKNRVERGHKKKRKTLNMTLKEN